VYTLSEKERIPETSAGKTKEEPQNSLGKPEHAPIRQIYPKNTTEEDGGEEFRGKMLQEEVSRLNCLLLCRSPKPRQ
jgi:hypothetical protein